ncbi:M1 family metallopeptidase [Gottfriedia acidiceleris]|uniref:M1 family metallopeptidase n=1 Tax=Gottfriedia acidiceleris TaxID=371036 RepID=UPI00101E191E|nr:M1 family metallopeptidase [Gottfriedia acidiceleris]
MNNRSSLIFLIIVISLILASCQKDSNSMQTGKVIKENFKLISKSPGVNTVYNLSLKMKKDETFDVQAFIDITNTSKDKLNSVELYFIPNMFTKENSPTLQHPSKIRIQSIRVNDIHSPYNLVEDQLTIPLKTTLEPDQTTSISISYSFTLPDNGFRFTKQSDNFYLAQWYPMVPTYIEGRGWNKLPYQFKGESYHTAFSNFNLKYEVPNEYTVITTSDQDELSSKPSNQLSVQNVKEVFVGILKKPSVISKKVGKIDIRLLNFNESDQQVALDTATKSLVYFQSIIGPYPFKQLDIIASDAGMEYPGVVTVDSTGRSINTRSMIVHEIAHQWFYGVISNDPYHDAWLDEGFASFATSLFLAGKKEIPNYKLPIKLEPKPSNLSIDQYMPIEYSSYVYGQSANELLKIFNAHGGRKTMERFLKEYFAYYQYKEVDTKEFLRFMKYELRIKEDKIFEKWLNVAES